MSWPCHRCTHTFGPTRVRWGSYPARTWPQPALERGNNVWRTVREVALSWTNTKLFSNVVLANGTMEFLRMSTYWKRLRVPLTNTNSDLAPWWIALQTMTVAVLLPSVAFTLSSSSLFPCVLCTSCRPSWQYRTKRDLSANNGASILLANSDGHGSIVCGACGDLVSGQESSLVSNHG